MTEKKTILIIGNGPSTRELADCGFHNLRPDLDTFGMGAAYRFFREVDWWPTYYALGDSKVVLSHQTELAKAVEDSNVYTERFYLSWPVTEHPRLELIDHCSTGDFCLRKCVELRYHDIFLIGTEGHYVEEILESRPLRNDEYFELGFDRLNLPESLRRTLRIISETPEDNPNYFFHGYQQTGDVYSLPQSSIHRNRWKAAAACAEQAHARVLNLSETSRILDFPRSTLSNIADRVFCPTSSTQPHRLADVPQDGSKTDQEVTLPRVAQDTQAGSTFWYGPFDRESQRHVEETRVVLDLFSSAPPTRLKPIMFDVGACHGSSFRGFAKQDWQIHVFEPNPILFNRLCRKFDQSNVTLNRSAVSDANDSGIPFFTSEESIGISSLAPFRATHELTARIDTVTLDDYLAKHGVSRIEFLKIDTEGFDLMVLKGLDLLRHPVDVILCEFEDRKTKPLGYSTHDLARHLNSFGYTMYVSEWHPITRYGATHQWRALKLYPCELEEPEAWGNLLAFKNDPGFWAVTKAFNESMRSFDEETARRGGFMSRLRPKLPRFRTLRRAVKRPLKTAFRRIVGNRRARDWKNQQSKKAA